jgi:Integrase core domain
MPVRYWPGDYLFFAWLLLRCNKHIASQYHNFVIAQKACRQYRFRIAAIAGATHFAESFNGRFRDECLNEEVFRTLREARRPRCDRGNCRPSGLLIPEDTKSPTSTPTK